MTTKTSNAFWRALLGGVITAFFVIASVEQWHDRYPEATYWMVCAVFWLVYRKEFPRESRRGGGRGHGMG
jgi:hypothetical protein